MKREEWCRSRVGLCDRVAGCNLTVAASETLSRDKVAQSRDVTPATFMSQLNLPHGNDNYSVTSVRRKNQKVKTDML